MRADEIDERIDAALKSYAEPPEMPEPRVVLARLLKRARPDKTSRWRRWVWLIPASGCAVTLLAAVVWVLYVPRLPEIAWTPQAPGVVSLPVAPAAEPAQHRPPRASAPRMQYAAETLPKLETFPAPAPVSPEEQKLVDFAQRGPSAAKQQMMEARQHVDDPLEIAELKIQPLDESDNSAQAKGKEKP
jgi:hypothetical protein